ncbi:hypothetical protein C7271_10860 [filamentous cyanobacterium CCP5]|nr:hypothetical protein C7271_10860 [filamentous cyanobacterium CCP5]
MTSAKWGQKGSGALLTSLGNLFFGSVEWQVSRLTKTMIRGEASFVLSTAMIALAQTAIATTITKIVTSDQQV